MSVTEEVLQIFRSEFGSGNGKHPEIILDEKLEAGSHNDVVLKEEQFIDDSHRWFNQYHFIYYVVPEDRWILVDAGIGKTEYQENEIWDAREVRPQEKVITTIEYINV